MVLVPKRRRRRMERWGERVWVGRAVALEEGGRGPRGGGPGTVTQFNPRLLAMKPDEMRNRGKMNELNDRGKR